MVFNLSKTTFLFFIISLVLGCSHSRLVEIDESDLSNLEMEYYEQLKYLSNKCDLFGNWIEEVDREDIFNYVKVYEKLNYYEPNSKSSIISNLSTKYKKIVDPTDEPVFKINPKRLHNQIHKQCVEYYTNKLFNYVGNSNILRVCVINEESDTYTGEEDSFTIGITKITFLIEDVLKSNKYKELDTLNAFYSHNADNIGCEYEINHSYYVLLNSFSEELDAYHVACHSSEILDENIYLGEDYYGIGRTPKWDLFRKTIIEKFSIFNPDLYNLNSK